MAESKYQLNTQEKNHLVVTVDGKGTYKVPLPGSMSLAELNGLWDANAVEDDGTETFKWSVAFFKKYLGDIVDDMTLDEFAGLSEAWQQASTPSLGER